MNVDARNADRTVMRGGNVVPFLNSARRDNGTRRGAAHCPGPNTVDLAKHPDVLARLHAILTD